MEDFGLCTGDEIPTTTGIGSDNELDNIDQNATDESGLVAGVDDVSSGRTKCSSSLSDSHGCLDTVVYPTATLANVCLVDSGISLDKSAIDNDLNSNSEMDVTSAAKALPVNLDNFGKVKESPLSGSNVALDSGSDNAKAFSCDMNLVSKDSDTSGDIDIVDVTPSTEQPWNNFTTQSKSHTSQNELQNNKISVTSVYYSAAQNKSVSQLLKSSKQQKRKLAAGTLATTKIIDVALPVTEKNYNYLIDTHLGTISKHVHDHTSPNKARKLTDDIRFVGDENPDQHRHESLENLGHLTSYSKRDEAVCTNADVSLFDDYSSSVKSQNTLPSLSSFTQPVSSMAQKQSDVNFGHHRTTAADIQNVTDKVKVMPMYTGTEIYDAARMSGICDLTDDSTTSEFYHIPDHSKDKDQLINYRVSPGAPGRIHYVVDHEITTNKPTVNCSVRDSLSHESLCRDSLSRENINRDSLSHESLNRNSLSREGLSRDSLGLAVLQNHRDHNNLCSQDQWKLSTSDRHRYGNVLNLSMKESLRKNDGFSRKSEEGKENVLDDAGVQVLSTWKVNVKKNARSQSSVAPQNILANLTNAGKKPPASVYDRTPHPSIGKYYVPPLSKDTFDNHGLNRLLSSVGHCRPLSPYLTSTSTALSGMDPHSGLQHTPYSSSVSLNSSGSDESVSPPDYLTRGYTCCTPYNTPTEYPTSPTPTLPTAGQLNAALYRAKETISEADLDIGRQAHNAKERARRARIKLACEHLRDLVPGMTLKTDKATVFEFAVQYIAFLKQYVGMQYDKEFLRSCSPY